MGYPYAYHTTVSEWLEGKRFKNIVGDWRHRLMAWDANEYDKGTYIIFREMMFASPHKTVYMYGDNELESVSQIGYLDDNYQVLLDKNSDLVYNVGENNVYITL